MADNAPPPNLGNETDLEFITRPEFAPNYQNPDGGDLFETLSSCANANWPRSIRDHLRYLNRVLRCEQSTPLSDLICNQAAVATWRASDDGAYAIQAGDFAAAGILVPQYFWHLNGDNSNKGSGPAAVIKQEYDDFVGRAYSYVRVEGRPGGSFGANVIGMRTFFQAVGFNEPYDSAIALGESVSGSVTLRVSEWPQANEKIVLMAIKHRQIDAETGAEDRFNFEFGLGPSNGASPGSDNQAYALYLRWISSDDVVETAVNEIVDEEDEIQGVGITPGYEWTLGFHRYENPASVWYVDFYVNGVKTSTWGPNTLGSPSPGSSFTIRLLLGAGSGGKQHAGGPVRNAMFRLGPDLPAVVSPLMAFLYQKGAGWI